MQNVTPNAPEFRFWGLFKAVLAVFAVYYVLFGGLGFETDTELRQFLDEAAKRPPAADAETQNGGI